MISKIYITNIKINTQFIIVDMYLLYIKYNLYSLIKYYIKVIIYLLLLLLYFKILFNLNK